MHLHPTPPEFTASQEPYFDGSDTENASYRFSCAVCQAKLQVPFSLVHRGAWGWREEIPEADVTTIERFFGIEPGRQTPPKPWPSISSIECSSCKIKHVFYASYDEYRNSVFRLIARGLAYSDA